MSIQSSYAGFAETTSWYKHADERNAPELSYLILGLVGESGEFADAFKKIIRRTGFTDEKAFLAELHVSDTRDDLVNELGDVLWYLTRICDFLDLDLNALMVINTYKLYNRLVEKGTINVNEVPWPFEDPSYDDVVGMLVNSANDLVVGELSANDLTVGSNGTTEKDFNNVK